MAFQEDLAAFKMKRALNPSFLEWGAEEAEKKAEKNGVGLEDHIYDLPTGKNVSVYLAGSIEMDSAPKWQRAFTEQLQDLPVTVLSPRRKRFEKWDDQTKNNSALMRHIEWEWNCMKRCNLIAMYLHPGTMSRISLMELGHFSQDGKQHKILVCCPPGFDRQANVQFICKAEGVTLYENVEVFLKEIRAKLKMLLQMEVGMREKEEEEEEETSRTA